MKVATVLTSRVMQSICQLPGVATLDWCDRAAAAVTKVMHPCAASAALLTVDPKGFIGSVEVTGAALSQPPVAHAAAGGRRPNEAAELDRLRDAYREGDWLGWNVGPMVEGTWYVSSASAQGLLAARGESPLMRRWDAMHPADVILGAVGIPGEVPGRMLVIEVAVLESGRELSRETAVLAACLPMLGQRVLTAVGPRPADRHKWLTPREELILWHLVAGKKVPQIAAELHRSIYTVHDHVKSLHRKLGASNRGQLVARALGHLGPLQASAMAHAAEGDDAEGGSPEIKARGNSQPSRK
jgi:DNA-binding CsgD family transcriptional regulator